MLDGHHPNELGYALMAEGVARKILEMFPREAGQPLALPHPEELKAFLGWDRPEKSFAINIGIGRWFTRLATWRYDPEARLDKAEQVFTEAREIDASRHEPYLGLAVVHYLRKEPSKAEHYLATAREIDPRAVSIYVEKPWIQSVIQRSSRWWSWPPGGS